MQAITMIGNGAVMNEPHKKLWFAAKRYGYGAGLPITWQGWAAIGALLAICLFSMIAAPLAGSTSRVLAAVVLALPLVAVVPFARLCRGRTAGGWKWRWVGHGRV